MIKLEDIEYSIRHILKSLGADSSVKSSFIHQRIADYRAYHIKQEYRMEKTINPVWVQDYGVVDANIVNSADDPTIQYTSLILSKVDIPQLINLDDRSGVVRLSGVSSVRPFSNVGQEAFFALIESGDSLFLDNYIYYLTGNKIYIYPHILQVKPHLLLSDPLNGVVYTQIENPNGGVIGINGTRRNMTSLDPYPIDGDMAYKVVLDILTKDFQIRNNQISDIRNDFQDEQSIKTS